MSVRVSWAAHARTATHHGLLPIAIIISLDWNHYCTAATVWNLTRNQIVQEFDSLLMLGKMVSKKRHCLFKFVLFCNKKQYQITQWIQCSVYQETAFFGIKLNCKRTQYARTVIFQQCKQGLNLYYIRRKVFGLCLFYEIIGFIDFIKRTRAKLNTSYTS